VHKNHCKGALQISLSVFSYKKGRGEIFFYFYNLGGGGAKRSLNEKIYELI